MTSNSDRMTVAERLAQRLKNSEMGTLMDEDTITALSQDAIKLAFFQPREVSEGYNRKTLPPLVAEYAIAAFKEHMKKAIEPVVDTLVSSDDFKIMVRDAIINIIPEATKEIAYGIVNRAVTDSSTIITTRLQSTIGAKLGISL